METLKNTLALIARNPYACFLGGFALAVGFGVWKLLALVQALGAA